MAYTFSKVTFTSSSANNFSLSLKIHSFLYMLFNDSPLFIKNLLINLRRCHINSPFVSRKERSEKKKYNFRLVAGRYLPGNYTQIINHHQSVINHRSSAGQHNISIDQHYQRYYIKTNCSHFLKIFLPADSENFCSSIQCANINLQHSF